MKKILVVVDMQKDFVDGALGTKEAVSIIPAVSEKIRMPAALTFPISSRGVSLPSEHVLCI